MIRSTLPAVRRILHAPLAVALLALTLVSCARDGGTAAQTSSAPAGGRSDFRLASLEGGELGPPDFRDHVVLVDFWATWCVPCHAQAAVLADIYAEYAGDKVQFLAVDVGEEDAQVRRFVDRSPFPYPVLLDPDSELADSLGISSLPTVMVIDRKGDVTYLEAGVRSESELRRVLEQAGA